MTPRLQALYAEKQTLINAAKRLETTSEWTDQDKAEAAALPGLINACDQAIDEAQELAKIASTANESLNGGAVFSRAAAVATVKDVAAEAGARYRGRVRNFSGATEEAKAKKAYQFGMWVLATMGKGYAQRYCAQNGIAIQSGPNDGMPTIMGALGQSELNNEDGGYLVPHQFENDLIVLREQYGVFRQFAKNVPMSSDSRSDPRRKSGLTAYFVGDGEGATASKMGWDRVQLNAKKSLVLAYVTTELNEDSIISMGDTLAGEIAYAFAKLEDDCGFNGDGTSPYGSIVGVRAKLRAVDATIANIKGLQVGSGNAYSELVRGDFQKTKGLLPQYADTPNTAWFVHKTFFHSVMEDLILALGGVTIAEQAQLESRTPIFLGYPVRFSQQMPKAEANSQVCAVFGDLNLAASFGDRRITTVMFSEHAAFTSDEIAVRGSERFDINVHDVGDTTDAGPVVGLITAAS